MLEGFIAFAVLAVLMLGGNYLLRRRSRSRPAPLHVRSTGGAFTLRAPRKNAVMFGITVLLPAGLLGFLTLRAWEVNRTSTMTVLGGGAATLLTLGFAVYQFASAFRSRVVVDDSGIERIGVFTHRLFRWGSIAKISFNPAQHWFFVTASDGSRLWLPADIAGMGDFAIVARRQLPPAVLQGADPVVREVLDELADDAR